MPYGWIITRDYICNGDDNDVMGPHDIPEAIAAALFNGDGDKFRMYDDDGEHYYDGRIIGNYNGLEPLEDFGMPNAGCTEVKLWKDGKWMIV